MAKPTTSGFTISGLLDRRASTRNDYPVERIPIEEIADHPANAAYSMDEAGIAQLAKSIEEEGLTDLPLVRKLDDGGWQMVSGHRRKAAYALLAKEDEKYAQIPCRVIRGITDEQSVMLLHAANYFVRSLTVTERAAASRALGVEVERMRAENPELSGVRTEDIKAAIISEQTGRKVSGKTIQRQESLARKIEERLTPQWREAALADALSADAVGILADLDSDAQDRLHATWRAQPLGKKETTEFLKKSTAEPAAEEDVKGPAPKPAAALASALRALRRYESKAARVVFSRSLKASFTAGASSTMKTRCSPSGMGANSCRMPSRESFSSMAWRMVSYSGSAVNSDRSSFAHSATLRPGSAPPSIASSPRARLNADASRSPLAIMAASPAS